MNENIDLTEILKDCPKGWKLYTPMLGEVDFIEICYGREYSIRVADSLNIYYNIFFSKKGFYLSHKHAECLLFPSKEQRDWSKFTAPWYKKERFDPKTLKPFDRVLCKNGLDMWRCDFFSSYMETYMCQNVCISGSYSYCIPYNDDTKHLVGTTDEAPEYYKYWND